MYCINTSKYVKEISRQDWYSIYGLTLYVFQILIFIYLKVLSHSLDIFAMSRFTKIHQYYMNQLLETLHLTKFLDLQVLNEIKSCCQALSERLEQQKYFFGDQ